MKSAFVKQKKRDLWCIGVIVFLLLCIIISIVILAAVPPVSKDALTHHLAVPKLYLKHGGIHEIPWMRFSYYPMNLDLVYLIPLYFGIDIIPKFIHFGFALLTAWLVFGYLRNRVSMTYALGGALFFLSIPIVVKLSITAYVDLGVIFFSTASLLLLLKWFERDFQARFLIMSGICCGLAMGTKYNGLILCFLLTLFVPFIHSRYGNHVKNPPFLKNAEWGLLFFFIALLVFSPWIIRNYVWTHNPIYPLYDGWFNPENTVPERTSSIFAYRSIIYKETWWEILLLPLRVFFQGLDGNPQYFDGKLNPFLLILPLCAFYRIKKDNPTMRSEKMILLALSSLFFAFAFFSTVLRIRYISSIIPPLVILSIYGVKNMFEFAIRLEPPWKQPITMALFLGAVSLPLLLNGVYIYGQYKLVRPFDFLSGSVTREEYITIFRREYPVMEYINKNLPQEARVLFIFMGNRGYYCDREYVFDMKNCRSKLRQLVKTNDSSQAILNDLRRRGITHLLIRRDIFDKWVRESFDEKDKSILNLFLDKYVRAIFTKGEYGLYRLGVMVQ